MTESEKKAEKYLMEVVKPQRIEVTVLTANREIKKAFVEGYREGKKMTDKEIQASDEEMANNERSLGMRRIYISGKITGDDNYKHKFEAATKALLKFFDNKVDVINPAKLDLGSYATWEHYMRIDIQMLCSCDTIYMLSDWKKSKGARFEHKVAKKLGIEIVYESV